MYGLGKFIINTIVIHDGTDRFVDHVFGYHKTFCFIMPFVHQLFIDFFGVGYFIIVKINDYISFDDDIAFDTRNGSDFFLDIKCTDGVERFIEVDAADLDRRILYRPGRGYMRHQNHKQQ